MELAYNETVGMMNTDTSEVLGAMDKVIGLEDGRLPECFRELEALHGDMVATLAYILQTNECFGMIPSALLGDRGGLAARNGDDAESQESPLDEFELAAEMCDFIKRLGSLRHDMPDSGAKYNVYGWVKRRMHLAIEALQPAGR